MLVSIAIQLVGCGHIPGGQCLGAGWIELEVSIVTSRPIVGAKRTDLCAGGTSTATRVCVHTLSHPLLFWDSAS
jgi:hypothetical protein